MKAESSICYAVALGVLVIMPAYSGQDCGTSTPHQAAAICASGTHTSQTSPTDKRKAEDSASQALGQNLINASGVICGNCTTVLEGLSSVFQCGARATMQSGTMTTTYEEINPGGSTPTQGWKVTNCWTGTYNVSCETCP